jgi:hypothetical protein
MQDSQIKGIGKIQDVNGLVYEVLWNRKKHESYRIDCLDRTYEKRMNQMREINEKEKFQEVYLLVIDILPNSYGTSHSIGI